MDTPLHGGLFIGLTMVAAVAGLLVVRRYADVGRLKQHHEVVSFFFLMIGTLYAVLIAFAIFVVWTSYQNAGNNLEREANAVGDLSRLAAGMPEPLRDNLNSALLEYIHSVLEDEFPAMAEGRDSNRTWAAMQKLWQVLDTAQPTGEKEQVYFSDSVQQLDQLSSYRRIRLFTSRGTVPQLLWYLLYFGAALLVAFTYLFGHESLLSQAAMTAALVGILALSLFLVVAYDSPFAGPDRVSAAPYRLELQHVLVRQ